MPAPRRRRNQRDAQPPVDHDWVDFGGQRIWAVGFTEGGAPYGLTEEEYEAAVKSDERERMRRPTSAHARDALCEVAGRAGVAPNRRVVGPIRRVGEGLSNVVFRATIRLHPDCDTELVVKLPAPRAGSDRELGVRAEAALLRHLQGQHLPFAVPRPFGEVRTGAGLAVMQEWVEGFDADLRAPRFPGGKPWDLIGEVAAGIHALDPGPLRDYVPFHLTRRDHVVALARRLSELDEPEARDTDAWIREHLVLDAPGCLLHGDLLGQNLRCRWHDTRQVGVIDWAATCIGDPAYDLAIVTRGHRKPFAVADGLARLVEAYNRLARAPLSVADIQIHELILHAGFYQAAARDRGRGSPHAEQQRLAWRSLLRRATQARE